MEEAKAKGLDALAALKEKQAKRRIQRAEEEKKLLEQKKLEDERKQKEEAEAKAKEAERKRLEMEEAEKKRQEAASKKGGDGEKKKGGDKMAYVPAAMGEKGKSKEQLAEEKRVALAVRVSPLVGVEEMGESALQEKANEFWKRIVKLETEKYDLEMRMNRQDYDIRELR